MSNSMRWSQDTMSVQLLLNGKYRAINKQQKPVLFDSLRLAIHYAQGKNIPEEKAAE